MPTLYIYNYICIPPNLPVLFIFIREKNNFKYFLKFDKSYKTKDFEKSKIYCSEEYKPLCSCVCPVLHKVKVILHTIVASILSYAKKWNPSPQEPLILKNPLKCLRKVRLVRAINCWNPCYPSSVICRRISFPVVHRSKHTQTK